MSPTDGTTAIHVSPAEALEPDMRIVFDMFTRASNAIVNASELAKRVAAQEADNGHLREALSALEEANRHLSERLSDRIAKVAELTELAQQRGQTIFQHEATMARLNREASERDSEIRALREDREHWRKEAHDWADAHSTTAKNLEDAERKLATMRQTMQSVFGEVAQEAKAIEAEVAKPALPEPNPPVEAKPEPAHDEPFTDRALTNEPLKPPSEPDEPRYTTWPDAI